MFFTLLHHVGDTGPGGTEGFGIQAAPVTATLRAQYGFRECAANFWNYWYSLVPVYY